MTHQQFSAMVQQYERLVYTVCFQLVRDAGVAEDLSQDAFLSAWTHRDSCPCGNEKPWLVRIAANKAKDYLKSAHHRRTSVQADEALDQHDTALFSCTQTPEQALIENETRLLVQKEIDALKDPYREVAALYLLADQSMQQIAQTLGRPQKTVQTQIYRAKRHLRSRLSHLSLAQVS